MERLKTEMKLLEQIFVSTHMLLAYMDTKFNILRVNKAFAEFDGHNTEYYIGKNHEKLFPNKENHKIFKNVIKTGKSHTVYAKPFEYALNPERGTTYWDWTAQAVKDDKGKVIGLLLSLVDVTERQRMQNKLLDSYKHLGVINRQLAVLMQLNKTNNDNSIQDIIKFIMDSALQISNAKVGTLYRFDKNEKIFNPLFSTDEKIVRENKTIKIADYSCLEEFIEKKTRFQGNFNKRILQKLKLESELKCYMILPLLNGEELKGAILVCFLDELCLTPQELEFYDAFAWHATNTLNNLEMI